MNQTVSSWQKCFEIKKKSSEITLFLFYQLNKNFPELKISESQQEIIIVFFGILFIGTSISLFSTYFAAQRYLNLKTDKIY